MTLQVKAALRPPDCGSTGRCDPGSERNLYYPSKLMTARDFTLEQHYGLGRRRLINRALFGWGVVGGLRISAGKQHTMLTIGPGLALDRYGREIALGHPAEVSSDRMIWMIDAGATPQPGRYLLAAHYAEMRTEPVRVPDLCGCGETEWNRICETVVYSLWPDIPCDGWVFTAERPCPACGCPSQLPDSEQETAKWRAPCLCAWSGEPPLAEPPPLCEREGVWLDPDSPVPLAWVTVTEGGACPVFDVGTIDDCLPRRIVKRNELLYDLIRGCDLTHLETISWREWHLRPDPNLQVTWADFAKMFDGTKTDGDAVWTDFVIGFDGPVQDRLMNQDVVAMTAVIQDGGYRRGTYGIAWGQVLRVPILKLTPEPDAHQPPDPPGTARSYRCWVDQKWWDSQVSDVTSSRFCEGPSTIEIEIRGDLILDCRSQAVDANAVGRRNDGPFGNGTPGGTFLSIFPLERRSEGAQGSTTSTAEGAR